MEKEKIGQLLLKSGATLTALGGFLADWNKTHLYNPRWTAHPKFHDAMTILLGSMLGGSSLYLLQRKSLKRQVQLTWAAALPSFFWGSMLGSFLFPGAKGLEAEFPKLVPKVGPLRLNEAPASVFMLLLLGGGYMLAKQGRE